MQQVSHALYIVDEILFSNYPLHFESRCATEWVGLICVSVHEGPAMEGVSRERDIADVRKRLLAQLTQFQLEGRLPSGG